MSLQVPPQVASKVRRAGGFEEVMAGIPSTEALISASRYHLALSDPKRLKILWALSSSQLCPCLLKKITRISDSRLSYHLKVLEDGGLIHSRRSRSWRIYSITELGRGCLRKNRNRVKASFRASL